VEHQDAPETPGIDTLCNVDAVHDVVALPVDDLPRVACEVVVRVDAAGGHDLGIRCSRLVSGLTSRGGANALI
jgi:hypothetical protein